MPTPPEWPPRADDITTVSRHYRHDLRPSHTISLSFYWRAIIAAIIIAQPTPPFDPRRLSSRTLPPFFTFTIDAHHLIFSRPPSPRSLPPRPPTPFFWYCHIIHATRRTALPFATRRDATTPRTPRDDAATRQMIFEHLPPFDIIIRIRRRPPGLIDTLMSPSNMMRFYRRRYFITPATLRDAASSFSAHISHDFHFCYYSLCPRYYRHYAIDDAHAELMPRYYAFHYRRRQPLLLFHDTTSRPIIIIIFIPICTHSPHYYFTTLLDELFFIMPDTTPSPRQFAAITWWRAAMILLLLLLPIIIIHYFSYYYYFITRLFIIITDILFSRSLLRILLLYAYYYYYAPI